jgi:signal transduction histidine kinase
MVNNYIVGSAFFAVIFIGLGLIILSRNSRSKLNRLFLIFSFCLAIWLVNNYIAGSPTTPYTLALWANRLVFLFGGGAILALLAFVKTITGRPWYRFDRLLLQITPLTLVASVTPFVVQDVALQKNTYTITFGILSFPYFLLLITNVVVSISELIRERKHAENARHHQINTILKSFGLGMAGIIITNALLPFVFNYYGLTNAGSFFCTFFVVGIAYAIVKHRLFDLRLVVARSLAYILTLSSLVGAYSIFGYLLTVRVFETSENSTIRFVVTTGLLVISALSFGQIKKFFDRITNRLFYRDAYDAQALLDRLNRVLVSTYKVDVLLNQTAALLNENIKSESAFFIIEPEKGSGLREFGSSKHHIDDLKRIHSHIHSSKQLLMVADELDEGEGLQRNLREFNLAIVVKLVSGHSTKEEVGYLVLGNKKSGNPYNRQDIRLITIIANELVIAIQNALRFEEIENFNITLQQKVEDATRQLRRTNEKLKILDETKDEFISMASHQLRTPLTAVKGYLSMVIEGDAGKLNDMQHKLLNQAFISSQRMVYLIADLLNVSRLRTGKFILELVPSNLADVVEGEISQLYETAQARNITLKYNKPADFPTLTIDETKTRQVIMNFTDNAIYYGKSGGRIDIDLKDTGKSIEFTVTDDGIGVPKSEQHHLFTKFYRAGNARKARPDGTGLGLFMAKKVIVAQGGAIIFHSTEGKGSTFGFSFDKTKLMPGQATQQPAPAPAKAP